MNYATLMVHLKLGQANTALLKVAGDLAQRLHASVIGIAICQPMRIIYNDGYVPGDIIEQDRQTIDNEIKAAESELHAALENRVAMVEYRSAVTYSPLSEHLAKEVRSADLVITCTDQNYSVFDTSRHVDLGDFVMRAGRPCLIVPAATEKLALDHVVVGWKDTSETRRAIYDALPLLKQADRVTVVEIAVEDEFVAARARLEDVAHWLKRHGICATPLAFPSLGDDAVRLNMILEEQEGDLLIAGAYSHNRLREWVLGGVTKDLLLRARRCSLVSH